MGNCQNTICGHCCGGYAFCKSGSNCYGFSSSNDWCPRTEGICCNASTPQSTGLKTVALLTLGGLAVWQLTSPYEKICFHNPVNNYNATFLKSQATNVNGTLDYFVIDANGKTTKYKTSLPSEVEGFGFVCQINATHMEYKQSSEASLFAEHSNEHCQPIKTIY